MSLEKSVGEFLVSARGHITEAGVHVLFVSWGTSDMRISIKSVAEYLSIDIRRSIIVRRRCTTVVRCYEGVRKLYGKALGHGERNRRSA